MDQESARKHFEQLNEFHWGKGKVFDITVGSTEDNALLLSRWLYRPEALSDEDKLKLFSSLELNCIGLGTSAKKSESFYEIASITLPSLIEAVRRADRQRAEAIIEGLISIIGSRGVSNR